MYTCKRRCWHLPISTQPCTTWAANCDRFTTSSSSSTSRLSNQFIWGRRSRVNQVEMIPLKPSEGMLGYEIGSAGCCCCSAEAGWVPDDNTEELMDACRLSFLPPAVSFFLCTCQFTDKHRNRIQWAPSRSTQSPAWMSMCPKGHYQCFSSYFSRWMDGRLRADTIKMISYF